MKVVVTGGGGFLGSAICRLLRARGDTVLSIARTRHAALEPLGVLQAQVDISVLEPLLQASRGADAMLHVAARAGAWFSRQPITVPSTMAASLPLPTSAPIAAPAAPPTTPPTIGPRRLRSQAPDCTP